MLETASLPGAPGVVNFDFAWNRGVSFSLLRPNSSLGSLLLSVGAAAIVALLLVWALRAHRARVAAAFGLMIGGALGNLVDRFLYGAVFDFLVMPVGGMTLFVCNLADIAITLGAFVVLIDSLLTRSPGQRWSDHEPIKIRNDVGKN